MNHFLGKSPPIANRVVTVRLLPSRHTPSQSLCPVTEARNKLAPAMLISTITSLNAKLWLVERQPSPVAGCPR